MRSSAVEGPVPTGHDDQIQGFLQIFEHITRGNSQRRIAKSVQRSVAMCVSCRTLAARMRFAVHLNRQSPLETGEIEDISCNWELTPKPKPSWALPKLLPQQHFGKAHLSPQFSSEEDVLGFGADGAVMHS